MSGIQRIALVLTIIGAINWGLIGFSNLTWSLRFSEGKMLEWPVSFMDWLELPA